MLKRQHRLLVQNRLSNPTSLTTPIFILKVAPNHLPQSRFGFIVRKALDKRATKRNRVRRVFRSCIEQLLPQIKPGYDFLFILQKKSLEYNREDFLKEIEQILQRKQYFV